MAERFAVITDEDPTVPGEAYTKQRPQAGPDEWKDITATEDATTRIERFMANFVVPQYLQDAVDCRSGRDRHMTSIEQRRAHAIEQQQRVVHSATPMYVQACPGAGKTRCDTWPRASGFVSQ